MTGPGIAELSALAGMGLLYVGDHQVGPRLAQRRQVVWSSAERSYGWQVATHAHAYLDAKAARLDARAEQLRAEAASEAIRIELETGVPPGPELLARAGLWHAQRATGARERAERVDQCQQQKIFTVACDGCGCVHERPARCSCGLLCASCRGHRKGELQREFSRARAVVMERALKLGLLRARQRGGAYGEKFLTLTVPHAEGMGVSERIRVAFEAWKLFAPMFARMMRAHEATHFGGPSRDGLRRWWLFRRFEWTPGADGEGHPHFHVWLLAPYIRQETLRNMWRAALSGVRESDSRGKVFARSDLENMLLPDIRQVTGDVSRELIKYITKDWHEGKRLAPQVYARVFEALDGRRLTQASRGFMALAEQIRQCPDCGEHHPATVEIRPFRPGELSDLKAGGIRGPPTPAGVPGLVVEAVVA